jgi:hypothetical protein
MLANGTPSCLQTRPECGPSYLGSTLARIYVAHRQQTHHGTFKTRIEPFLGLANEADIGFAHAPAFGLARVLRTIKDEHLARYGLGRDQVWVLWHVARAVDLPGVVDPLYDVDARLCRRQRVSAEFATLLVIRAAVEHVRPSPGARWNMHRRDLEVVCRLPGRVGA